MPDVSVIDLITAIETRLKKVSTQSLDLSFNELLDMYDSDELDISPDYQRLFQWSEGARSRFIESLLLEMPVPPIYVVEEEDNKYLLIDGLQRISSYLHLRGKLNAPQLDPPVVEGQKLQLTDCDIVKELNGKTFDDLGTALQIKLKRAFIRVEVVRKGSDPRFKYHMFKRLNTGGEPLTPQQLRNCSIRLLSPTFIDFIKTLRDRSDFQACTTTLTNERILAAFDEELILRFFAFRNNLDGFKHDITDFLTQYMEGVSDPSEATQFNYKDQEAAFDKTFAILATTLGEDAFTYANKQTKKLTRGFGVLQFEAFTIGLQPHLGRLDPANQELMGRLATRLKTLKADPQFIDATTGGGKNSPGLLRERIKWVDQAVAEVI
jgi:Protein of unknown function DUF262